MRRFSATRFLQQTPNTFDYLACANAVRDHALDRQPRFFDVRVVAREQAQTGVTVCHDRAERLVEFVRYGSSQFAEGGDADEVRQFSLRVAKLFFGSLPLDRLGGSLVD
jgi:hypothetical protein